MTNDPVILRLEREVLEKTEALRRSEMRCSELGIMMEKMRLLQVDDAELHGQIKELRRSVADLSVTHDRYFDLYEFAPVGYLTVDLSSITHINVTGARMLGRERDSILGYQLAVFLVGSDRTRLNRLLRNVHRRGGSRCIDVQIRRGDKTTFYAQLDCVRVSNDADPAVRITMIDITERKRAEADIRQLAFYDPLTGLPNRRLLLERLSVAIASCQRKKRCGAVLFLDLDEFKALNDKHGHASGDLLLVEVGERLQARVRLVDTVGRLGGDEFVVLLEDLDSDPILAAAEALRMGEAVLASLSAPYQLRGMEHNGTTSMGITVFDSDALSVQSLLGHADIALYRAKALGPGSICYFDVAMQERVTKRATLLNDLRRGIKKKEFLLYFQPQVDHEGRWIGAEALLRWQHPTRGLVLPEAFMLFAEEQGLMEPIGEWVIEEACAVLQRWGQSADLTHLTLAVNVSAYEFRHHRFAPRIEDAISRLSIDPRKLILEFTEGLLFTTLEETRAKMRGLRARGIQFAIDDFGIGYSSLSYLQSLPLDQLKIDQSFVRDMIGNQNDAIIVRSIISLGQNLGLTVVAEGVETADQQKMLASQGCTAYQGYLFGRPVPERELMATIGSREQKRA